MSSSDDLSFASDDFDSSNDESRDKPDDEPVAEDAPADAPAEDAPADEPVGTPAEQLQAATEHLNTTLHDDDYDKDDTADAYETYTKAKIGVLGNRAFSSRQYYLRNRAAQLMAKAQQLGNDCAFIMFSNTSRPVQHVYATRRLREVLQHKDTTRIFRRIFRRRSHQRVVPESHTDRLVALQRRPPARTRPMPQFVKRTK